MPESESIKNLEEEFIDYYSLKDLNFTERNETTDYSQYQEDIKGNYLRPIEEKYPNFTTYKYRKKEGGYIQRTIDYMFVSKEEANKMEVTAWLDPPRDDQLNKEMAAPCVD